MEELIAYDCRWRSRQPCRCYVASGGSIFPPCVEFPWLCPPASVGPWYQGESSNTSKVDNSNATSDGRTGESKATGRSIRSSEFI